MDEPPILVVEVSSPSTSRTDQREKLALYERFGVLEYWIVDPAGHAVSVFSLNPDGKGLELVQTSGHVRSRVFPDLVMFPDEVFRDL